MAQQRPKTKRIRYTKQDYFDFLGKHHQLDDLTDYLDDIKCTKIFIHEYKTLEKLQKKDPFIKMRSEFYPTNKISGGFVKPRVSFNWFERFIRRKRINPVFFDEWSLCPSSEYLFIHTPWFCPRWLDRWKEIWGYENSEKEYTQKQAQKDTINYPKQSVFMCLDELWNIENSQLFYTQLMQFDEKPSDSMKSK